MKLRSVLPAFVLDAVLILIFAAIGRGSHAHESTIAGLFETGWPFLLGLTISWVVAFVWKHPVAPVRAGLPLWIGTLVIGMSVRVLSSGQGTALPFVLVASGSIGLMLVGWRALAETIRRRGKQPSE